MSDGDDSRSRSGLWARVRQALHGRISGGHPALSGGDDDVVRASKVLRRLLDLLVLQPSPILIDLGPAIGSNVSFFGEQLGCTLHVEDLFSGVGRLSSAGAQGEILPMLASCLAHETASVDAVIAWDLFDYLTPEEAAVLAARLVRVLRPGGLVMACFTTTVLDRLAYRKYIIEDGEHLRHRWLPYSRSAQRVLYARDVDRLFTPLEVVESHLLMHHQRETLLRRPTPGEKDGVTAWHDRSSRS
jgi:hypothetical protein